MATLKEYFDADFGYTTRMLCHLDVMGKSIEFLLLYDFSGYQSFISCYVRDADLGLDFFLELITAIEYGNSQVSFDGNIKLPPPQLFPGKLHIDNGHDGLEIRAQFFGDSTWTSFKELNTSRRLFIYSESDLSEKEILELKKKGANKGHNVQFRSHAHVEVRNSIEKPLAFISHDSRDKVDVARPIALGLQRLLCSVWYDEFSLKVGDRLRESIEKGLKECRKCVLVLSPNFMENNGWTKVEFNTVFTREILEESKLVLPVWHGVTKEQVFEYSPSLLNIKGVNWSDGEEAVCRALYNEIVH